MDERSVLFLEVMIGIAIVGLVAFLIVLVASRMRQPRAAGKLSEAAAIKALWPQILLAVVLLIVVTLIVLWQFPPFGGESGGATWRTDSKASIFFIVMLVAAGLGLLAFLGTLVVRSRTPGPAATAATPEDAAEGAAVAQHATPSGARLMGLFVLALAFLLLNWIYVPRPLQYALMLQLIYPATFAVALVLLFDKATRAWSAKNAGETFREWLLCDAAVFMLVLGFLNLMESKAGDKYAALIWDLLHVVLFFGIFWLLDRKTTRLRFLAAYAYLTALPVLLLIWRAAQGVAAPKTQSWWETIWPVFFLGVVFFVLEVIAVVASKDRDKQAVPAIKDALYVVLLGVILIASVPGTGE